MIFYANETLLPILKRNLGGRKDNPFNPKIKPINGCFGYAQQPLFNFAQQQYSRSLSGAAGERERNSTNGSAALLHTLSQTFNLGEGGGQILTNLFFVSFGIH
ncbi:hypothetical protein ACX8XN_18135 [Calditrichota bacterium GD2]